MHPHLKTLLRYLSLALLIAGLGTTAFAQTFAYVVETGLQDVAVIDTSTNTVVAQIPVPEPFRVVLSPDGSRAYVGSVHRSPAISVFVTVIDTATNAVIANIQTTNSLSGLAVSPDGATLYATELTPSDVAVIDTATNSITSRITVPDSHGPHSGGLFPVVSPDGTRLYVGNGGFGDIYIIDTASGTIIDTIAEIPANPALAGNDIGLNAVAVSPDGTRLYATNHNGVLGVSVIDTATNVEIGSIPQPGMAQLAVSPNGSQIWACGIFDGGPFYVLDTATFAVTTLSDASSAWFQAALTPDGTLAYVVDGLNNTIVAWDTTTFLPVASIPLAVSHPPAIPGSRPKWIAIGSIPPAVPFAAFTVAKLQINAQGFSENGSFTLGTSHAAAAATPSLDPVTQNVTLTAGSYSLVIPAGSFRKDGSNLHWKFEGKVGAVRVNADIKQQAKSTTQFDYAFDVKGPNLTSEPRPIRVGLKIGLNVGTSSVQ